MTRTLGFAVGLLAVLAVVPATTTARDPAGPRAVAWLARTFQLSTDEVRTLTAGHSLARSLSTADDREIATLGIARIRVPPAWFADAVADIVAFKAGPQVPEIGVFSDPPRAADLSRLTFERGEIRALRQCRPGHCDLQLPAGVLAALTRVPWTAGDAAAQAQQVVRDGLVDYAGRYRAAGATAAMTYVNDARPVDVPAEFAALARSDTRVLPQFPALRRHLLRYPVATADVRDLLYWSREKMARASVVTMTHVAIAPATTDAGAGVVIASKQIYGSRYFDASLGLAVVLPAGTDGAPASYVAYLNRSRVDAFGGLFGGITRRTVRMRTVSGTAEHLQRITRRLEADYAAGK